MNDTAAPRPDSANALRAPLLHLGGRRPPAPDWFAGAMADLPVRSTVTVAGVEIEALAWGRRGDPGLLLLHGFSAHADWWSFIAPFLAAGRRVVACSFSGMGGSGWRDAYSTELHAAEAVEVAQATGLYDSGAAPVVVGHSYGGRAALLMAHDYADRFKGFVIVDTPFDREPRVPAPRSAISHRRYASLEEAVSRFRFIPPQPCENAFILDHIARTSLKAVRDEDGVPAWVWKFDPDLRAKMTYARPERLAIPPSAPVALILAANSQLITPERRAYTREILPADAPWFEIPAAGHHVMADQPLPTVAALEGLLSGWPRS